MTDGTLPAHVTSYQDRHSRTRYRFRRRGIQITLPGSPSDDRFHTTYEQAANGELRPRKRKSRPDLAHVAGKRPNFLRFCIAVCGRAADRARVSGYPFELKPHMIDRLLVDQHYRCAVSGIRFDAPTDGKGSTGPFCPSIDRIEPKRGYVAGNVRIVCNIVNAAMNNWGVEPLITLAIAMNSRRDG